MTNRLPPYNRVSCQINIEYNAMQIAVRNAIIKSTVERCSTANGVQYDHAIPLFVSIYQQIRPVSIDANKDHFIRGHRTTNQLIGVASCEYLHIHKSRILKMDGIRGPGSKHSLESRAIHLVRVPVKHDPGAEP